MTCFSFDCLNYSRNHKITRLEGIFRDLECSKQKTSSQTRQCKQENLKEEILRSTCSGILTSDGVTRRSGLHAALGNQIRGSYRRT